MGSTSTLLLLTGYTSFCGWRGRRSIEIRAIMHPTILLTLSTTCHYRSV
ncbi:hypothetical protein LINPERPRIM_LOCUS12871 [Linum perenne]